jgi:hypothetical protein
MLPSGAQSECFDLTEQEMLQRLGHALSLFQTSAPGVHTVAPDEIGRNLRACGELARNERGQSSDVL